MGWVDFRVNNKSKLLFWIFIWMWSLTIFEDIVNVMTEITPDVTIEVQEEEIKTPKQVDELNQTTDSNLL